MVALSPPSFSVISSHSAAVAVSHQSLAGRMTSPVLSSGTKPCCWPLDADAAHAGCDRPWRRPRGSRCRAPRSSPAGAAPCGPTGRPAMSVCGARASAITFFWFEVQHDRLGALRAGVDADVEGHGGISLRSRVECRIRGAANQKTASERSFVTPSPANSKPKTRIPPAPRWNGASGPAAPVLPDPMRCIRLSVNRSRAEPVHTATGPGDGRRALAAGFDAFGCAARRARYALGPR